MAKFDVQKNLGRPRINEEDKSKLNMVMVVDIFSSVNIVKYFGQQKPAINIEPNIYHECKKSSNCRNINCSSLNELIMLKELIRDDRIFDKMHMGFIPDKTVVVDNGHITNMLYLKLSNKKMFKIYMREFKHRKHNWNYIAYIVKNTRVPKNDFENKLNKELNSILKQAQIECVVFDRKKYRTPTLLKKEIKGKILYYFNELNNSNVTNC